MKKFSNILSFPFGLFMLNAGLNKFLNYMPMPDDMSDAMKAFMEALLSVGWLVPLIAVVEIVAGLMILFPKTRLAGALAMLPISVGILLTNTITDTSGLAIGIVVFVLNIGILFCHKDQLCPLMGCQLKTKS
ncbi:MAG: DoxX family membrane protein [Bacteroidetes bacterium]|jgi:putative oxidoreductase|nr:DoxX family membrane protein [Bacteroidota bacterium]MDA0880154.1 DoxX family membrane protein [Bacteroidota bacterium]MDA1116265.1 DoxX family membrane protein [Bacteroidota bacterium]